MRIQESHGVDFTTFQLEGRARRWWQSYLLGRPAGSPPVTWGEFTQLFLDRYIPPSKKEELWYKFGQFEQGRMSVTDYEERFSESSRHALMILPTDVERVRRFFVGLHSGIRANMAREVEMGTSYQLVVMIARRIEGYRHRGREQIQQDNRDRFSREFKGAPARGRGQFGRVQPSRPQYSSPPPTRGAPARPNFSVTPESSYRPPASQGSSSGYSGYQVLPAPILVPYRRVHTAQQLFRFLLVGLQAIKVRHQGQHITAPRGCFECGDLGHMRRSCPRLRGKAVQHGQQPMITAPDFRPPEAEGRLAGAVLEVETRQGEGSPPTLQPDSMLLQPDQMHWPQMP
ncbi:uncharacterized protein [Nicotiana tomentosiformis]|uniref:uncharacterized protein n=1 Tax=Nicotiana tomentosiformis TaxID=4098 RepID=UPI00388C7637